MHRHLFLAFSTLGLAAGSALPAQAQIVTTRASTIFEDVRLSPGVLSGELVIRGISGGPVSASQLAGRSETPTGPCLGFVDEQADHQLELTGFFDFLDLQIQSAEDTTLVVRGPGGVWCNDNYTTRNPGIAGQWLPGLYEIWIGSHRANGYYPYIIRMTDTPVPQPATAADLQTPSSDDSQDE